MRDRQKRVEMVPARHSPRNGSVFVILHSIETKEKEVWTGGHCSEEGEAV